MDVADARTTAACQYVPRSGATDNAAGEGKWLVGQDHNCERDMTDHHVHEATQAAGLSAAHHCGPAPECWCATFPQKKSNDISARPPQHTFRSYSITVRLAAWRVVSAWVANIYNIVKVEKAIWLRSKVHSVHSVI